MTWNHIVWMDSYLICVYIREDFKYYFADFVRKWGTPPPFTDFFFGKKGVTDLGGTPAPPFTDKIRKVVFEVLPNTVSINQ